MHMTPTPPIQLYRVADLRRIEALAAGQALMQRAGLAAADLATQLCDQRGAAILVLAGSGSNGGDAFEAAMHLRQRSFDVHLVFVGDVGRLPTDAAAAYRRFVDAGGTTLSEIPDRQRWSLIVDGLFGIGLKRKISPPYKALIKSANALAARDRIALLALDCPSGLDADTGKRLGEVIKATHTITFIGAKPGLFTADGTDQCGSVTVAPLDLDPDLLRKAPGATIAPDLFAACLRPRLRNSHKGLYGNAGILGGAAGMVGGALLAARAALRLGSGRVYLGLLDAGAPALDPLQPELMLRPPKDLLAADLAVLACGPGLGRSQDARFLLEEAFALDCPLLLDADALNLLAGESDLRVALALRTAPTLLTPHPSEAARLLDKTVATVQADRLAAAGEIATRFNAWVALKGAGTIIATPAGQWFVNTNGNPGLATAGSGDVLTGLVTALIAQGWPPLEAMLSGVHMHGAAADALVTAGYGPVGLVAGE
ncbi:MAG: NAD(P)H-hydrate dehydratase, partial [Propionivibrio sp.]